VPGIAEVGVDELMNEGAYRDLPIIGSLVSLWRFGATVRDALFLRKVVTFLADLKQIRVDKRRDMLDSLADSAAQEDVGEKLVGLLDRLDSSVKARLLAKALAEYCKETISADEFWRLSFIVERLPMGDIVAVRDWKTTDLNHVNHVRKHLYLSVGLGWFVLNMSSTGFVWHERLCTLLSSLVHDEL
jgi:hypothetical protein